MTSQGTAHGRFERAIAKGHLLAAATAAREFGQLSLGDALSLTILLARSHSERFERAAVRWHGRLCLEAKGVTLADAHLGLAALMALRGQDGDPAADTLAGLVRRYGIRPVP